MIRINNSIYEDFKSRQFNPASYFHYEIVDGKRVGRSHFLVSILRGAGKLPTICRDCYCTRHSDVERKHMTRNSVKNSFKVNPRNYMMKRISKAEIEEFIKEFNL